MYISAPAVRRNASNSTFIIHGGSGSPEQIRSSRLGTVIDGTGGKYLLGFASKVAGTFVVEVYLDGVQVMYVCMYVRERERERFCWYICRCISVCMAYICLGLMLMLVSMHVRLLRIPIYIYVCVCVCVCMYIYYMYMYMYIYVYIYILYRHHVYVTRAMCAFLTDS